MMNEFNDKISKNYKRILLSRDRLYLLSKKKVLYTFLKKNFMYLLKQFDESSHLKKSNQYKNQYVFNKNSTCSDFVYFKLIRNKQIIKI